MMDKQQTTSSEYEQATQRSFFHALQCEKCFIQHAADQCKIEKLANCCTIHPSVGELIVDCFLDVFFRAKTYVMFCVNASIKVLVLQCRSTKKKANIRSSHFY